VLAALALGERQYKELKSSINDIEERVGWVSHSKPLTDRVLSDTLRRAQQDGLIERHAEPGRFGGVWYTLTPMGRSLLRAVRPLAEWAQKYHDELELRRQTETSS
jgi:DNA-binding HxlR family transcriptional regulator